ncbi:MAG: hypothetical protein PHR83_08025 [Paludibacter sp.]|nr:hypothetical protein [Paludibacter sp.]
MNKSTIERAKLVQAIVKQHYEAGRQDKCKRWVYKTHVKKIYPMDERTFWRLMKIKTD